MHQVTSGALHGLLDSLDPDSSYLSPLEYTDYKERIQSKAAGISGLALSKRNGYIIVISVLPDSPAQAAGLHSSDYIESIAGFTTSQMSIGQARVLLTGAPGSTVKLSVIRRAKVEPEQIDLILAKVPEPKILEERFEGDVAYLRLPALDAAMVGRLRISWHSSNRRARTSWCSICAIARLASRRMASARRSFFLARARLPR